ncbi:MAG: alcohol dehydrogenase catalytic domain-containing protein [Burkholderiales bacterium]
MKAIVVRSPGARDAMRLETIADPIAGPKDVIIKVEACGVCFHDVLTRNGTLKAGVKMPCVLGHEISGVVVALGPEARRFKEGQRVATAQRYHICGACRFCRSSRETLCAERKFLGDYGMVGGYAEFVAVEDDNVAVVPDGVALAEASIAACAIGTALNGIRDVGRVQMGESVLVTGAGGGVGLHAVQLARLAGALVIAQTTSPGKADLIRELGAHHVVVHERGQDFSPQVKRLTDGRGVDVLIDNVGTVLFEPMRRSLGTAGRWVLIGQLTGDFVPFNPAQLFLKNQSMLAVTSVTRNQLEDVLAIMGRGQVKAVATTSLPLEEAAEAHTLVDSCRASGRVLIRPNA